MSCPLTRACCPECGADINFKKTTKPFCNCKNCDWICKGECEQK
ncbi:hypothetical protein [Alkaliphilus peptidifermentans]|uniref:Uncharacterized protein n=1 Tax=Alkaliphilus peptidifermentans DSM 18978 TaxID=1120976 RepID=A0A1G5F3L1_9FIRM|nr:hypothetical protein [Alkaliphilus peptidifermentans]SCY33813.1 hypothetical protein SAMN03080606_01328 [Alkaliphilus peptidifermentans DSM 18978]